MRYDSELGVLQEDAKARQTEVTPAQLAALRERVAAETAQVYARMDLALAALDMYRADILYQTALAATADRSPKAVLQYNRDLYAMYDSAQTVFRKNLDSGAVLSRRSVCS